MASTSRAQVDSEPPPSEESPSEGEEPTPEEGEVVEEERINEAEVVEEERAEEDEVDEEERAGEGEAVEEKRIEDGEADDGEATDGEAADSEAGEEERIEDVVPGEGVPQESPQESTPLPEEEVVVVVGPGSGPTDARDAQSVGGDQAEETNDVVIVTGTRSSQMAGAVQVIGEKQLERTEYDDPHAVLRQVPGVFVREEDGTGLRPNIAMRGVNPDRSKKVTLMEDGVLFGPAPYSAPAAYYFPMMTRMTQVRVIKGPGAVAFGPQTVAGAIDLISRRVPTEPTLATDLSYGQYGYRKVHGYAGVSNEQFGVLFEGVHVGNDGFKELPDDSNTGAARNEWMAKAFYLVDPTSAVSNELSLKVTYSDEASNETYLGLTDADFEEDPDRRYPASSLDRMDNHRTSVALTHELKSFENDLELRTTAYRNDFFRVWRKFNRLGGASASAVLEDPEDPQNAASYGVLSGQADTSGALDTIYIGPNQRKFVSQGLFSRLRFELGGRHLRQKWEVGVRLHHDSIEREHSEDAFAMLGGELYPLGDQASIRTASNQASSHALAIHLSDAITWRDLTVTPGVRFEGILSRFEDYLAGDETTRTVAAVMPGVGIYYGILPAWGVLAGAHRGFSPPAPGTDETVKPEASINYEAGTRFIDRDAKLEVIGFFNDYSNLTDVCTFSSGCLNADLDRQFDAGRANIYGLEASLSKDVSVGPVTFPLSAAYTLSWGYFETDFDSADPIYGQVETGDEVPYLPRHQLNALLGLEVGRFQSYAQLNYVGATRELAGSEPLAEVQSTDPLVTVDVGGSVRVVRWLEVYLNARNVGDSRVVVAHRPFGARPNAPRWIQGGIKAEF